MVRAASSNAEAFLSGLDAEQRAAVNLPWDSPERLDGWTNLPTSIVSRPGLLLLELDTAQRLAANALLRSLLSESGWGRVEAIRAADQFLTDNASCTAACGFDRYAIAVYGTPSPDGSWAVQFGGHHLGLNITVADGTLSYAPTMTGAQPVRFTGRDGEEVDVFGPHLASAFALISSFDEAQRQAAYGGQAVGDLVCGPGAQCDFSVRPGVSGAQLSPQQQASLLELVTHWIALAPDAVAAQRRAEVEATIAETSFTWAGATTLGEGEAGMSLRISGPEVHIEFAHQMFAGESRVLDEPLVGWQHVHSVYRDPTSATP